MLDRPPKQIEEWFEWWGIVKSHLDDLEFEDMREMHQSDDFTAMEAVEHLKMERGL